MMRNVLLLLFREVFQLNFSLELSDGLPIKESFIELNYSILYTLHVFLVFRSLTTDEHFIDIFIDHGLEVILGKY